MNLYSAPPESLTIDGTEYAIDTDFRKWIKFAGIVLSNKGENETVAGIEDFIRSLGLPFSVSSVDAVVEFFSGGEEHKKSDKKGPQVFEFVQDSAYIYSAFLSAYRLDLSTEKLHWWKFKTLFSCLPDDCEIVKIMQYRGVDMKDVPKQQKKFYRQMKSYYSLKNNGEKMTTEDYHQKMIDHVRKRQKEAKERMEKLRKERGG